MTYRLHVHELSGHSHRARLFFSLLGVPLELVPVDLAQGAHKRPDYLALNTLGQVPVLEDDEVVVADSCAILVYLSKKLGRTDWLPEDALGAARVQRWLAVAAGQLAAGPAAARLVTVFGAALDAPTLIARSHALLVVLERELRERAFLAAERPTIADVALYTYVAHAPEGNVSLEAYPSVRAWLGRVEALPGFVPMRRSKVGLVA